MERELSQIYQVLQKLMGLHRQLLDTVRMEKDALTGADLSGIQEATYAKEALIEAVKQQERLRLKATGELALLWRRPLSELTLPNIVVAIQGKDPETAEKFRSAYNALTILIQRITEQNSYNKGLVERSLEHVQNMKTNVLGESTPKSNTYTQQGQRSGGPSGPRILSKEA